MAQREKIVFIDVRDSALNYYSNDLFQKFIDKFLKENKDIILDELIYGTDLAKAYLEVMNGNLSLVKDSTKMYRTLERIYDYWRDYKRYYYADMKESYFINENNFVKLFDRANEIILDSYRKICANLRGHGFSIYRQLPAAGNAFILFDRANNQPYQKLNDIRFISRVAFKTPFVVYSSSNTRKGVFPILKENPMDKLNINKEKWYAYPALVGNSNIYVYFEERYISLALSLSNLFEHNSKFYCEKPDGIILFGANTEDGIYFDKENNTYVASLQYRDEIDYFGYMKKIILTVHNIKMINEHKVPIHGAGVTIKLKNGNKKNVILLGDSGAGKSEVLETLRNIGANYIDDMQTIYDDMGTLEIVNNEVYTYGTEIGAFVRTNDLENEYVYKVFDRAIFLNPTGNNARLVLPVNNYQSVIEKYKVDLLLYANNYEEPTNKVVLFDNVNSALNVFEAGKRVALGTTNEKGLVSTYFANPFGPVQLKEDTHKLLNEYFGLMFKNNIKIGELYTGLSLENKHENIKEATIQLLELLKGEN